MSELCRLLRSEGYEACGDEDEVSLTSPMTTGCGT